MHHFESELGTKFAIKFESSHVISNHQVKWNILSKGCNGTDLNFSYEKRNDTDMMLDCGYSILKIVQNIPYGVLIFFPSYKLK